MRFRTLFLFLVLALTVLFALLNWDAYTAPATLSLVFGTVQAPVGLVMLGVVLLLGAVCLAYMIYLQGTALMDARRHARELQAQRELVDQAESSRYTELHRFVTTELRRVEDMHADTRALLGTAEEIPLPDNSVDAVLVAQAWHWVDPARAIPEVARVLRPGGRLSHRPA